MTTAPRRYLDHLGNLIFVGEWGRDPDHPHWVVFRRDARNVTRRMVMPWFPLRLTRRAAQRDLDDHAARMKWREAGDETQRTIFEE